MILIDTHSHLHVKDFAEDLPEVIKNACKSSVSYMLTIGTDVTSSAQTAELVKKYPDKLFGAVGIHPTDCLTAGTDDFAEIEKLLSAHPNILAVGETGLDLYWKDVPLEKQLENLRAMQKIAEEHNKPMIIHNRDALPEMEQYFTENPPRMSLPGVMHSFAGNHEDAEYYLDMGFYISFTGVITFKNFKNDEVVKYIPLERLLLETDSPFLAPVPRRGKRNEPAYLQYTAQKIAELKNVTVEELADITTENFRTLFSPAIKF